MRRIQTLLCVFLPCIVVLILMSFMADGQVNSPVNTVLPIVTPVATPTAYSPSVASYVRTWVPAVATADTAVVTAKANTVKQAKQFTQYIDGLGRPIEIVGKGISPSGYDQVSLHTYDAYGREQYQYLPYVSTGVTDGEFKQDPFSAQKNFYSNGTQNPGMQGEQVFYSEKQYEASPLSRIQKVFAPGNNWAAVGGDHPIQQQYLTNTDKDSVRIWTVPAAGHIPTSSAFYPVGSLQKDITADLQGHIVVSFTDLSGHLVLKKVSLNSAADGHYGWLCTYYVYDKVYNLAFVLAPKAVDIARTHNWTVSQVVADELCFQYTYDGRNRVIEKKLPGAGWEHMVYDTRDRLVFRQDSNLMANHQWLVNFYDGQNRIVMTALYSSAQTRDQLQILMNADTQSNQALSATYAGVQDLVVANRDGTPALYQAGSSITFQSGFESETDAEFSAVINPALSGETIVTNVNNPLPGISGYQPISYIYYDNYTYSGAKSFDGTELTHLTAGTNTNAMAVSTPSNAVRGLVTGRKIRVLGTDQWLTSTIYYDDYGRSIEELDDNLVGGLDVRSMLYNFDGLLLCNYDHHTNRQSGNTPEIKILTQNTYNDAQLLVSITKQVNDNPSQIIEQSSYDELGRLKQQILGNGLDSRTQEYNVRGWLGAINKDFALGNSSASNIHFGEALSYDQGFTAPQYNGNVAGIRWRGFSAPVTRAYGYNYDAANRVTAADYLQQDNGVYGTTKANYSVSNLQYDLNGNILSMDQMGMKGGVTTPVFIDQLHYKTVDSTNRLQYVWDNVAKDPAASLGDFTEPSANTVDNKAGKADYRYDGNGNLVADANKGIDSIGYNHLNQPVYIGIKGKGNIRYTYNAEGVRLQKVITDSVQTPVRITRTDYVSGFIYQNDTLAFAMHEDGRIRLVNKTGKAPQFVYDYFVKDHLGSVREVLTAKSDTAQYAATMETGSSATEDALFTNIENTRTALPTGYPTDNTTDPNNYVARTNGVNGQKIGPSLVLRVMAGDTLQVGVTAYYTSTGVNTGSVQASDMVAAILQAFSAGAIADGPHAGTGTGSAISTDLTTSTFSQIKQQDPTQNQSGKPQAFLNYALFDDQFNMVASNSGVKQVQVSTGSLQKLASDVLVMKSTGFLYIYTSNESAQDVYFDNLAVNYISGPLLEETHYYPYGLTMAGLSAKALKGGIYRNNNYEYNGKELERQEFADGSGLDEYDFGARSYDPQLGRWTSIDPMAELMRRHSPYKYGMDNPLRFTDPSGMQPVDSMQQIQLSGITVTAPSLALPATETWMLSAFSRLVDFIPFAGSAKQIAVGIYKGDGVDIAMGVLALGVDVFTAGEGGTALRLAETGAEDVLKVVAEDEVEEIAEKEVTAAMATETEEGIAAVKSEPVELHHSDPKFLGGAEKQKLTELTRSEHKQLHRELADHLEKYVAPNGKTMRPGRGNSGDLIRKNFSRIKRLKAMADFYKSPNGQKYKQVVVDFFNQHPDLK